MDSKFTVSGDKTKVTFEKEADTDMMQEIIGNCADHLWKEKEDDDGVVTNSFSEATNQEKLDIVGKHVQDVLLNMANSNKSIKAQRAARDAAAGSEFEL